VLVVLRFKPAERIPCRLVRHRARAFDFVYRLSADTDKTCEARLGE
jgi:hypothetical protein